MVREYLLHVDVFMSYRNLRKCSNLIWFGGLKRRFQIFQTYKCMRILNCRMNIRQIVEHLRQEKAIQTKQDVKQIEFMIMRTRARPLFEAFA